MLYFSSKDVTLINLTIQNNYAFWTNMLLLNISGTLSTQGLNFQNNTILLGSLVKINPGMKNYTGIDTLFYGN